MASEEETAPVSTTMTMLEGRVFARRRQFNELDHSIRERTLECCEYLTSVKDKVFQQQQSLLSKPVLGVRGKVLIEMVCAWLKQKETSEDGTEPEEDKMMDQARQIADALVLCGYLTLQKEQDKSPRKRAASMDGGVYIQENEILIPMAKDVTELKSTSVWSVVNGAVFAGRLKRKHGLLSRITQGKDVYVVVNEASEDIHFFETDLARGPFMELQADTLKVTMDSSQFEYGVKLWKDDLIEMINCTTAEVQKLFYESLVRVGVQDRNGYHVDLSLVRSFYELKDYDLDGNEVQMSKFKGRVLLVVNVACDAAEAEKHLEEFAILDEKYRAAGLSILAFPSNQFEGTQYVTNESLLAFVGKYDVKLEMFEKADVHGPTARPVFSYLKGKLSSPFNHSVKSNYVKFLLDHTGQPVRRYSSSDFPLSFEEEIQRLIGASANESLEANEQAAGVATGDSSEQVGSTDSEPSKEHEAPETEVSDNQLEHETSEVRVGDAPHVDQIEFISKNEADDKSITKDMTKVQITVTHGGSNQNAPAGESNQPKVEAPESTDNSAIETNAP